VKYLAILSMLALSLMWSGLAMSHALPEHSIPVAGAILNKAPAIVTIYFDSELEPVFSKLIVKNEQGVQRSQGNGSIDPGNRRLLETKLLTAAKGTYHVYWIVVSHDGHRTEGDYTFAVQ
jgi:methionine-rich copper-binding protein CopC